MTLFKDAQMADVHTPQMGDLGIHRPVQSATAEMHNVQISVPPHQLSVQIHSLFTLFATVHVASCTGW